MQAGVHCCQHLALQAANVESTAATDNLFGWIEESGGKVASVAGASTPLGYGLIATRVQPLWLLYLHVSPFDACKLHYIFHVCGNNTTLSYLGIASLACYIRGLFCGCLQVSADIQSVYLT